MSFVKRNHQPFLINRKDILSFSYPFDGTGFILAHAYYPYEFGSFGGDIHFDEDEDWRPDAAEVGDGLDFFTVAVTTLKKPRF